MLQIAEATAALDFRETAPAAATRDMYLEPDGKVAPSGSSPGTSPPACLARWPGCGKRIGATARCRGAAARAGHRARRATASRRRSRARIPARSSAASAAAATSCLLPRPAAGDTVARSADLAATLGASPTQGADGFYGARRRGARRGDGARRRDRHARGSGRLPGDVRAAGDASAIAAPRGLDAAALLGRRRAGEMLRILEGLDPARAGLAAPAHVHLLAEACRAGFAERNRCLGDPDFVTVPLDGCLARLRGASARRIEPGARTPPRPSRRGRRRRESQHTTHFSVVDRRGNAVAITTTLNAATARASRCAAPGSCSTTRWTTSRPAPARPTSTASPGSGQRHRAGQAHAVVDAPTIVWRGRRPVLVIGAPGGPTIITTVFQVLFNLLDFDMTWARRWRRPASTTSGYRARRAWTRWTSSRGGEPGPRKSAPR